MIVAAGLCNVEVGGKNLLLLVVLLFQSKTLIALFFTFGFAARFGYNHGANGYC